MSAESSTWRALAKTRAREVAELSFPYGDGMVFSAWQWAIDQITKEIEQAMVEVAHTALNENAPAD